MWICCEPSYGSDLCTWASTPVDSDKGTIVTADLVAARSIVIWVAAVCFTYRLRIGYPNTAIRRLNPDARWRAASLLDHEGASRMK